jgi:hypothetical protein
MVIQQSVACFRNSYYEALASRRFLQVQARNIFTRTRVCSLRESMGALGGEEITRNLKHNLDEASSH